MKECWHSDPDKRPTADDIHKRVDDMCRVESDLCHFKKNPTEITIESSDIGPVPKNNPGAIYKSRPLSAMINSAMSLRSSKSLSINLGSGKRKFEDLVTDNDDDGQCIKKEKLCENEINEYLTNEIEFDINMNFNQSHKPYNKGK
ncbi:hypothetical protein RhiirA4_411509 [Rhizophagus irregularis]|uniref:Serine-threonine/tyrosine-protein kinase catalytic domain-containing protein n=1 Tax=Rhizophagus irregularis TaxID=588596 RepID=A0A2I1HDS5_9GLOM|nr:hypothetical protein RhiirA4_411509 [Rhizophagus irregularis]